MRIPTTRCATSTRGPSASAACRRTPTVRRGPAAGSPTTTSSARMTVGASAALRHGRFYESNNLFGVETGTILGKWNFNEGQGSTAYDGTGNNNDATLTNMNTATCWVEGHEGQGLKFLDGTDYVDCGSYFTQTDNIVFDCWAKFDSLPLYMEVMNNGVFDIYYRGGTAGSYMWFRVKITNSSVYPGDSWWYGYAAVKGTTELATGQWYHFVGVRSGDTLRLYTTGVLDRELSCLGGYTINTAGQTDLKIGSGVAGTIDEASVYRIEPAGGGGPDADLDRRGDYTDGGVFPKLATTSDFLTSSQVYRRRRRRTEAGLPETPHPTPRCGIRYLTPVVIARSTRRPSRPAALTSTWSGCRAGSTTRIGSSSGRGRAGSRSAGRPNRRPAPASPPATTRRSCTTRRTTRPSSSKTSSTHRAANQDQFRHPGGVHGPRRRSAAGRLPQGAHPRQRHGHHGQPVHDDGDGNNDRFLGPAQLSTAQAPAGGHRLYRAGHRVRLAGNSRRGVARHAGGPP